MRILLLTQWFDPEPTFKGQVFAKALQRAGHEVEVLTGFPNYPEGKIYPGYRIKLLQREEIDGIRVIRVPLFPSHDSSAFRRSANYISFAAAAMTLGTLFTRQPDVICAQHPPVTVGIAAVAIGWIKRTPVVYDVLDLWPDTLLATGMVRSRGALTLVGRLCKWVYGRAAGVVVLSPGFATALSRRGVPGDKITLIFNWCDEARLARDSDQRPPGELGTNGRFNVVFAGTMGRAQGLETVLDAARLLGGTHPEIRFVLIGGGIERERLEASAAGKGLGNVTFLPRMPMSEISRVLKAADVLLVHLKDEPLFGITIPGKTQAYLAAGKPILMAVRGDAADLVESAGAGITCEPGNPGSLARAVVTLSKLTPGELSAMGKRGRDYYERHLSLDVGTRHFLDVFEKVAR